MAAATDYCTTQDVLEIDPGSQSLCITPNAPDYSKTIAYVTAEINLLLRSQFPHLLPENITDLADLKHPAIELTLHYLYRGASIRKGSEAIARATEHKTNYNTLMQSIHVILKNGETFYSKTKIVRG